MNPRKLEKLTGISCQTIYTIIKRDSPVRYDFALRISNATGIPIADICKENPYDDSELPLPMSKFENESPFVTTLLENNRAGVTANYHLRPVLTILGIDQAANVEQLITTYAKLNDDGRKALFDFMITLEKGFTDKARAKEVARIVNFKSKLKDQASD